MLIAGEGVEGDAHRGVTVRHRSRVMRDPARPNLRQVHLLPAELFAELAERGLPVVPGKLGENITTAGLPLIALAACTVLRLDAQATVRIGGLRNSCTQIEQFPPGLLAAVLDRSPEGALVRKAGIMGVVLKSVPVGPGDPIVVFASPAQHVPLQPVWRGPFRAITGTGAVPPAVPLLTTCRRPTTANC